MYSAVVPANATDKTIIWSVTNGTGSATISATGVLKAITDGTVTVTITSATIPSIFATMEISLSNQLAEDNTYLTNAIVSANDNMIGILIGADSAEYLENIQWVTSDVMTFYKNVIEAAQLVAYDVMASQVEVDTAVIDLSIATIKFNNAKNYGSYIPSEEIGASIPSSIPFERWLFISIASTQTIS